MSIRPKKALVSIVAPVYNEEAVIDRFIEELVETVSSLDFDLTYELVLVNDGSSDKTAARLEESLAKHPDLIRVVELSRNFGHQAAVSAGLENARGDAVILMDSDLQDDPKAFKAFLSKWLDGRDVVYAVRTKRKENFFTRLLFNGFYKIFAMMANLKIPMNAGNYSLMDRKVVDFLSAYTERNRYLPGLRAWTGFRQEGVPIERRARYDKKTRVGFRGKWTLAMNAIFSFSYVPIFIFRAIGLLAITLSGVLFLSTFIFGLTTGNLLEGLALPVIWISFFAGINLFGISVIGEYVARIYDEVKGRPQFIIKSIQGVASDDKKL